MVTFSILKMSILGARLWLICPLLRLEAYISLYLHWSKDFAPPEQIEGHLPDEEVQSIFNQPREPGPGCSGMQAAYPEVLFDYVAYFR